MGSQSQTQLSNWTELTELEKGDIILWPIHILSMYGLLVFSTYFHINQLIYSKFILYYDTNYIQDTGLGTWD